MAVRRARRRKERERAYAIRLRVFVREQGVPREIELDLDDSKAAHFLAYVNGKAVGTARVVLHPARAKIGRMAVLRAFRRQGVGKSLLRATVRWATKRAAKIIFLHAQHAVIDFYRKMGFRPVGSMFVEAGIRHRKMVWRRPVERP